MNDEQVMHAMGIDDAYRVERVLAQGAGGTTELVTLEGSGPFVRKRIPSKLARRGVWATLVECDCARLPHVEATYEMPDEFVVVCDYVPGENLEQLVSSHGRFAEKDARQLVLQLCEAVGALHEHGIVHRDISPTNVIVAADGAHLIDLGIARFRVEGATRDTTQLGTYGFASPEQYGFAQTDARSDVYSLGRMLGYLLTGVSPAEAERYEAALADATRVTPAMRELVARATAMEPSARYQTVAALVAALNGEKNPGPAASAPETPAAAEPDIQLRDYRRYLNPTKILVAFMALAAFAVAVVLILFNEGILGGEKNGGSVGDSGAPAASEPAPTADGASTSDEPPTAGGTAPDGSASGVAPVEGAPELEIVESGWSADSQGYVHYAFGLRNDGEVQVNIPGVSITGRDAEGRVLFSVEQLIGVAPVGKTMYFGSQVGNGTAPQTVEFSPLSFEEYQVDTSKDTSSSFSVIDARPVSDGAGSTKFVGEVTTEHVGDERGGMGDVALTVVLRNESGDIVYGDTGYARMPAEGESSAFEIYTYGIPDYATYEVHAQAW